MFGVVVCPRCGRAKGVELPKKTTTCPCGFEMRVDPSKVKFETANARELAQAVGRINAELHSGTDDVAAIAAQPRRRSRDALLRVVADAAKAGDRRQRTRALAEGLAREFVLFTVDDWRRGAEALGLPKPAEALDELVRGNVVYEPRPGHYRTL